MKQMLKEEWRITALHNFQLTVIEGTRFNKKGMFIIQGTSRGNSIVPLEGVGDVL